MDYKCENVSRILISKIRTILKSRYGTNPEVIVLNDLYLQFFKKIPLACSYLASYLLNVICASFERRRFMKKLRTILSATTILVIVALAIFLISLTVGRYPVSISLLVKVFLRKIIIFQETWDVSVERVLFTVRLPRITAAFLIGGALSLAGASYQGMFKNPMVSPDILGASAGAGFGAAIAILFSLGPIGIEVSAFCFSLGAVIITITVGKIVSKGNTISLVLVLTGMVVGSLFSAMVSITKYVADPESKLPEITFWLMGGLSNVKPKNIPLLVSLLIVASIPLFLNRWKLNILSFGDDEALSLGVDVRRLRIVVIAGSTLLTAACVSVCGLVGWIGLIIPHIARLLVGPDFNILLVVSILLGGSFLMIVDDIARCTFSVEIPLGILTALVGAPFFLYLLAKGKKGWG